MSRAVRASYESKPSTLSLPIVVSSLSGIAIEMRVLRRLLGIGAVCHRWSLTVFDATTAIGSVDE